MPFQQLPRLGPTSRASVPEGRKSSEETLEGKSNNGDYPTCVSALGDLMICVSSGFMARSLLFSVLALVCCLSTVSAYCNLKTYKVRDARFHLPYYWSIMP